MQKKAENVLHEMIKKDINTILKLKYNIQNLQGTHNKISSFTLKK